MQNSISASICNLFQCNVKQKMAEYHDKKIAKGWTAAEQGLQRAMSAEDFKQIADARRDVYALTIVDASTDLCSRY